MFLFTIWQLNSSPSFLCPTHAQTFFRGVHARALLCCQKLRRAVCRTLGIFVTNDRKYQTCLIFVVHDTSDKNPEYFPRTLGFLSQVIGHE